MAEFLAWVVVIAFVLSAVLTFAVKEAEWLAAFRADSWNDFWEQITASRKMAAAVGIGVAVELVAVALALVVLI